MFECRFGKVSSFLENQTGTVHIIAFRNKCQDDDIHKEGFVNCHWNQSSKLVYMHVDKCGSASVSTALRSSNIKFYPLEIFETKTYTHNPFQVLCFLGFEEINSHILI